MQNDWTPRLPKLVDPLNLERSLMNDNEKYIHVSTRTSHKRLEAMVMYALHYKLRDVLIHSQFPVLVSGEDTFYYLDAYLPALKLAIEIDEPHHSRQVEQDRQRAEKIRQHLGCEFRRITCERSIYEQIDELIIEIQKRIESENIDSWTHVPRACNLRTGEFTQNHIDALEQSGISDLMKAFEAELSSEGNVITHGSINGIPNPGSGELGFLTHRSGLTFAFYARKTGRVNVRVVSIDHNVPNGIRDLLHPRQDKNRPRPKYYALPCNKDGFKNIDEAKAKYYHFLELVEGNAGN